MNGWARMARAVAAAALAALAAGELAGAEVFRCHQDGKITYSDTPCGAAATRQTGVEEPRPVTVPGPAAVSARNLQAESGMGRVAVGMSRAQIEQAWGKPTEVAMLTDAKGTSEQWIYLRDGVQTTLAFEAEKVARISKRTLLAP